MTTTNVYGRQVVEALINKSGGGVIAGDVVVIDTTNDTAFTTSTAGGVTGMIGVAQETIANNATGRVLTAGYAALVNVNASVTRGNYGKTHTVVKQATDAGSSRTAGAFCQFWTGGTTPAAHLFGLADASTSSSGVPAGSSFPGSPANHDLYYRTDRDLLYFYNGTRWLTVQEYTQPIMQQDTLIPHSANANPGYAPLDNGTYDLWLIRIIAFTNSLTTNNGTNFWTVAFSRDPSGTSLGNFTTASDTASTKTRHTITVGALSGTSDVLVNGTTTKTLSPGNLYLGATLIYRLVG